MDLQRATEILRALADGNDPFTGSDLPASSPCQQPDTVRALYVALQTIRPARPKDPERPRAGSPWTEAEEQQMRDAFDAESSIPAIASNLGRTAGAVTARLAKLGLIDSDTGVRLGRAH